MWWYYAAIDAAISSIGLIYIFWLIVINVRVVMISNTRYSEIEQFKNDGMTLSEIGTKFGISRQAVHQILKRAAATKMAAARNVPAIDTVLADFRRRRQELDEAINALEEARKITVTISDS